MTAKKIILIIGGLLMIAAAVTFTLADHARSSQPVTDSGSVPLASQVATAQLVSPSGNAGETGVASRQFVDVVFVHGITARLPDLPTGQFYAGWLTKASDPTHPLPTGKLVQDGAGWSLSFSSPTDESSFDGVLVTVQSGDGQAPGTTVLEGSFHN